MQPVSFFFESRLPVDPKGPDRVQGSERPPSDGCEVNKPAGLHCRPCGFNAKLLTLEDYLPALVGPPLQGTHCGRFALGTLLSEAQKEVPECNVGVIWK